MLLQIIGAIVVLSILIVFHEFGHFIVAKKAGIKVHEFSLGFGPKLIGIKRGDTEYKLSLIPLGGYVKLAGMDPGEIKGEKFEFASKSLGIRALTIFAGPFFNLILAFIFYFFIGIIFGVGVLNTNKVGADSLPLKALDEIITVNGKPTKTWDEIAREFSKRDTSLVTVVRDNDTIQVRVSKKIGIKPFIPSLIAEVERDSPAWKAGLRKNDRIVKLDGKEITTWDNMVSIIQNSPEETLSVVWMRKGKMDSSLVIPKKEKAMIGDTIKEIGMIGVAMPMGKKRSLAYGFYQTSYTISLTFSFIVDLVRKKVSPKYLGGPIAVVEFTGKILKLGISRFLSFIAYLSIGLFILNLIPLPPLDGGQLLLLLIEKIRGRALTEKGIIAVQNIGFAFLFFIMIYVTFNDITRIIGGK
jgi:regulator of sigma E protease